MDFRRKLYRRGSSYETTIPKPLLFSLDEALSYNVVFSYAQGKWLIDFEEDRDKRKRKRKR